MSSSDFQPVRRDSGPGGAVRVRPVGVMLAAILLGLLGCLGLFSSFSILAVALFGRSQQAGPYPPGMVGLQIAMGFGILVVSAISVLVGIGLFQMKRWARLGILSVGGLMVVFYGLGAIGFIAFGLSSLVNAPNASAPNLTPAMMRAAFLSLGLMFLLLALVGAWWLVYFNLRRVRELFAADGQAGAPEYATGDAMTSTPMAVPAARGRSAVEVLVICLAVFYLLSAGSGIVVALLHFPVMFLGMIFHGAAAYAVFAALSVVYLAVGVGMLRRVNLARVAAIVLQGFWMVSSMLPFLPGRSGVIAAYQAEIMQRMSVWMPATEGAQNPLLTAPGASVFSVVPALLLGGAILWLLVRARPLFEK